MTKYIYLAGPMIHDLDPRGWRIKATELLAPEIQTLDPTLNEEEHMTAAEIVALDYGYILKSKFVLASVHKPSWGTAMELAFAKHHRVPVIAFDMPAVHSLWLRYHCDVVYSTLESAVRHIKRTF